MNCQRKGSDLKIHIRIALISLGRDPHDKSIDRLTLVQLQEMLRDLRDEQRKVGGILKEGV